MSIYFAFVPTKAVLVMKTRRTFGEHKPKAPSERELPTESGEGECVTIKSTQAESHAGSFHRYRGPPSSRRKAMLPPDSMEKEYEQNCSYSFGFFRQVKTYFMEGTPSACLYFYFSFPFRRYSLSNIVPSMERGSSGVQE